MDTIPLNAPQKQCTQCHQTYPATLEFFSKDSKRKDGLNCYCKLCTRANWIARNPKETKAFPEGYKQCSRCKEIYPATDEYFLKGKARCAKCRAENYREHQQEETERHKQYYLLNKQQVNAHNKLYNKSHPEGMRNRQKRHNEAHPEMVIERQRRYRDAHRQQLHERTGRWWRRTKEQNPARLKAYDHKKRILKTCTPGILTSDQIQQKLKRQKYCCYYAACGHAKFEKVNGQYIYHLEHTIPISRTEAEPRHDVNFVVLACPHCNLTKHNKLPHEWPEGGRLF